jgi:hypothetical protein
MIPGAGAGDVEQMALGVRWSSITKRLEAAQQALSTGVVRRRAAAETLRRNG